MIVDKPQGWTSHQVVGRLRRVLGTRKVGHGGTLDPMATGILVVGVGRATRLLGHIAGRDKTYLATIRLGQATVTDDAEGSVLSATDAAQVVEADIRRAMAPLTGRISQVPSAVSAIKVDGKRAYARVRAGEAVQLKAREVTVHRFEMTGIRRAQLGLSTVVDVDVEVDCTTGTYIRALARDLGESLKVGGHLTKLRRTRIGPWDLHQAEPVSEDTTDVSVTGLDEAAAQIFPTRVVSADQVVDVRHGRRVPLVLDELTALVDPEGRFLALYTPQGTSAVAEAVFAPA